MTKVNAELARVPARSHGRDKLLPRFDQAAGKVPADLDVPNEHLRFLDACYTEILAQLPFIFLRDIINDGFVNGLANLYLI